MHAKQSVLLAANAARRVLVFVVFIPSLRVFMVASSRGVVELRALERDATDTRWRKRRAAPESGGRYSLSVLEGSGTGKTHARPSGKRLNESQLMGRLRFRMLCMIMRYCNMWPRGGFRVCAVALGSVPLSRCRQEPAKPIPGTLERWHRRRRCWSDAAVHLNICPVMLPGTQATRVSC
jgi:hypothetical protein